MVPVLGGSLGVDWGRYWGAELAVDFIDSFLNDPNEGKVGEYAMWTVLAQLRLRYPVYRDKLVPYLLLGGGVGTGEFNDRQVDGSSDYPISGALDSSLVGAVGGGLEYFVAPNIALGVQAKHRFLYDTEIKLGGQPRELDLDSTIFTAGMRVYFAGTEATGPTAPPPADSDALRGYLALRAGGAVFTSSQAADSVELVSPVLRQGSAALGLNINKYLGFELALDYAETDLDAPGLGTVGEYTVLVSTGQVRLRYPVMDDRLSPYVILGGGLGFGEYNDRAVPTDQFEFSLPEGHAPVATAGAGFDYFIAENVAVGVEAKHVFLFDLDANINGRKTEIGHDTLLLSAGLRIFFP